MKHFKKAILALLSVSILAVSCQPYRSYTDTATVNGTTLFYAAEGRGKPVILLHGNGGSHNQLETTTRQLAQAGWFTLSTPEAREPTSPLTNTTTWIWLQM